MKNLKTFLILIIVAYSLNAQTMGFNSPIVIVDDYELVKKLVVIDIDKDGDLDVVAASSIQNKKDENIAWFENTGSGYVRRSVETDFQGARTVKVADIDYDIDGKLDIVAVSRLDGPLTWWQNIDIVNDSWTAHPVADTLEENHDLVLADLNEDGYIDLVTGVVMTTDAPDSGIAWYENNPASPGTFMQHVIPLDYQILNAIKITDLDNDGDLDILSLDWGGLNDLENDPVFWLENDGSENFIERSIDDQSYQPTDLYPADIDADGDEDVVVALWGNPSIPNRLHHVIWFENDGKSGSDITKSWNKHLVGDHFYSARSVSVVDLNGDGHLDILGVASDHDGLGTGGYVSWWENDGSPADGVWARTDLITDFDYAYHAVAEDMDDDGDLDVIASAMNLSSIYWWENTINAIASNITINTPYDLWNNKVQIEFSSGPFSGSEYVKLFFDSNDVPNRTDVNTIDIHHVAYTGYYTMKTDLANYTASLIFYYNEISDWSAVSSPEDLIICHWDGNQWVKTPNQNAPNTVDSYIEITNFSATDDQSFLFTLGTSSPDNSLPVELISFNAAPKENNIILEWRTSSEVQNLGFRIMRSKNGVQEFKTIADYLANSELAGQGSDANGASYSYNDKEVLPGTEYRYQLFQTDYSGLTAQISELLTETPQSDKIEIPREFRLLQNYPNPFNSETNIGFDIPESNEYDSIYLTITIYDIEGRIIKNLISGNTLPGSYSVIWDGTNQNNVSVSSGNYLVEFRSGEISRAMKIVLSR